MKEIKQRIILMCLSLFSGILIGLSVGISVQSHRGICTNNESRDYAYEAYCDSIWQADSTYYLDVLAETDEYQLYVEKHGSWWSNNNK